MHGLVDGLRQENVGRDFLAMKLILVAALYLALLS